MSITPPSLPSISLRESTFADDSSLALQAIVAEQSIASLQKLGSTSEQLQASLNRQRSTAQTIGQLQVSREQLRAAEVNESQATLAEISAIGDEPPANLAELQDFLSNRNLPNDLSTPEGRSEAIAALSGYAADVQQHPDTIDNPATRQRISQDATLQQILQEAKSMLGVNQSFASPADLANLQSALASEAIRLAQAVRAQVAEMVQGAQQIVVLSTDSATLGSQLVVATARGQQAAANRLESAQREFESQTIQLNESVRELNDIDLANTDRDPSRILSLLVDQVADSAKRIQAALTILQPDAAVAAARSASAIDLLDYGPTGQFKADSTKNLPADSDRPPRLLDPNRLV